MGFVDKDRIGVQGHSWGGYQIAYMITRTNLFAAVEAGAPVANMTSAYGGIRWDSGMNRQFQYEQTQSRIGGTLWEETLRYIENSPLFEADKVQTPLLMMHNDEDGAVPWYQGIELFMALRRLQKPVWMLNYNGEPHGLRQAAEPGGLRPSGCSSSSTTTSWTHRRRSGWTEGVPAVMKGKTLGLEVKGGGRLDGPGGKPAEGGALAKRVANSPLWRGKESPSVPAGAGGLFPFAGFQRLQPGDGVVEDRGLQIHLPGLHQRLELRPAHPPDLFRVPEEHRGVVQERKPQVGPCLLQNPHHGVDGAPRWRHRGLVHRHQQKPPMPPIPGTASAEPRGRPTPPGKHRPGPATSSPPRRKGVAPPEKPIGVNRTGVRKRECGACILRGDGSSPPDPPPRRPAPPEAPGEPCPGGWIPTSGPRCSPA